MEKEVVGLNILMEHMGDLLMLIELLLIGEFWKMNLDFCNDVWDNVLLFITTKL